VGGLGVLSIIINFFFLIVFFTFAGLGVFTFGVFTFGVFTFAGLGVFTFGGLGVFTFAGLGVFTFAGLGVFTFAGLGVFSTNSILFFVFFFGLSGGDLSIYIYHIKYFFT
jgi:hypothetical protein